MNTSLSVEHLMAWRDDIDDERKDFVAQAAAVWGVDDAAAKQVEGIYLERIRVIDVLIATKLAE